MNIQTSGLSTNGNVTTNGFLYVGNVIFQWGTFVLPSGGTNGVITFPQPFPNNVFIVVPSQGDSAGYGYPFGVDNLTTTGCTLQASAGGINAGTGYYIAIGN